MIERTGWYSTQKLKRIFSFLHCRRNTNWVQRKNHYSELESSGYTPQREPSKIQVKHAEEVLKTLREDSGTEPDLLPTRILKYYAADLALPVKLLTLRIIATGIWPESWLEHWIVPLYKKKSVYEPNNYRGKHLTAQLSKPPERLLKSLFVSYLDRVSAFGPRQFAYTVGLEV